MQIDFSKKADGSGAEPVKPVVQTQTVNTPAGDPVECKNTHTEVATVPAGGLLMGDRLPTFSEIVLPRLNLVHSVGNMKDQFEPGSFVYDQRLVLFMAPVIKQQKVESAGTPPLIITVLGLRPTRYFENVKGGGRGIICDTEDQVRAEGGTTNYQEWTLKAKDGMKRFDLGVDCLLAIERPECVEDNDTVFTFPVGNQKLALCLYNMKGSAHTILKKTVYTARSIGCLTKGYPSHSWALSSILKPTPDKSSTYWCPALVPHKKSSPEFLEFAASVLNAKQVDTPEAD